MKVHDVRVYPSKSRLAPEEVVIETSHHTPCMTVTGANDPQKMDPGTSRETLDHPVMSIVAVALQDGAWHHVWPYAPERARRADYVRKFRAMTEGLIAETEAARLLAACEALPGLRAGELNRLHVAMPARSAGRGAAGIF